MKGGPLRHTSHIYTLTHAHTTRGGGPAALSLSFVRRGGEEVPGNGARVVSRPFPEPTFIKKVSRYEEGMAELVNHCLRRTLSSQR